LSRLSLLTPIALALGGCNMVVLDPAGDIARQQGNLILISTGLMLLIIVPVMAATVLFAWRYRAKNTEAKYDPDWDHSTQLELMIWAAPLLIIICLGALTWLSTHLLDPYRPLARTAPNTPLVKDVKPLEVNVVALDWKWLFIYPEYGIATVNELAAPLDRPIRFRITATSVMNSFYIPALAGQIYAMPGMETKLHAVANEAGEYQGFSANYSGAGFSHMRFRFKALSDGDFGEWVAQTRRGQGALDRPTYLQLERPSENVPAQRYARVDAGLFDAIVNMCVEPGKMCMHDMMRIDAKGGLGLAGIHNTRQIAYDKYGRHGAAPVNRTVVAALCTAPDKPVGGASLLPHDMPPADMTPLTGAGLSAPRRPLVLASAADDARAPSPALSN